MAASPVTDKTLRDQITEQWNTCYSQTPNSAYCMITCLNFVI
jgi:translation initiation factor eIF-2B subunit alpha